MPILWHPGCDDADGPTPQSGPGDIILTPVGDITAALVNANETFFEVVSGVTELGLFELAEPPLRELRLDVVANQIDINYFDLLKPATIEEVEGVSELLTAPRSYLNRVLEEGEGPLEALDAEAGFVADTVVTRVGNAGDVVESYVQKQVDYFTEGFPTPSTGTSEIASVPASVRSTLEPAETPVDNGAEAAKDATRATSSAAAAPRKVARGVVRAQREVVGGVSKAATDVAEAAASGDTDKTGEAVAKAPRTVAKGVQDGARKAANSVKKAADDVRKAVKDSRPSNTDDKTADKE